jgi:hypothetical protein
MRDATEFLWSGELLIFHPRHFMSGMGGKVYIVEGQMFAAVA